MNKFEMFAGREMMLNRQARLTTALAMQFSLGGEAERSTCILSCAVGLHSCEMSPHVAFMI
jgi:hypothetical protein